MNQTIPYRDAWTRARDHYVEDLLKEEKDLYATASAESIYYDASAAQKSHSSSSTGVKVAEKLRLLVATIK